MPTSIRRARSLFQVVLPVAVASVLVFLAIVNMALVKAWKGEPEDGVLWAQSGTNVIAREVDPKSTAARAGVQPEDVLVTMDGREMSTVTDVRNALHASRAGQIVRYVLQRQSESLPLSLELQLMPLVRTGLYYSVALVGILAIVVGASVRLRRPADRATGHFFWLTVSFFAALAFTPSGLYDRLDFFFDWADLAGRLRMSSVSSHLRYRLA